MVAWHGTVESLGQIWIHTLDWITDLHHSMTTQSVLKSQHINSHFKFELHKFIQNRATEADMFELVNEV